MPPGWKHRLQRTTDSLVASGSDEEAKSFVQNKVIPSKSEAGFKSRTASSRNTDVRKAVPSGGSREADPETQAVVNDTVDEGINQQRDSGFGTNSSAESTASSKHETALRKKSVCERDTEEREVEPDSELRGRNVTNCTCANSAETASSDTTTDLKDPTSLSNVAATKQNDTISRLVQKEASSNTETEKCVVPTENFEESIPTESRENLIPTGKCKESVANEKQNELNICQHIKPATVKDGKKRSSTNLFTANKGLEENVTVRVHATGFNGAVGRCFGYRKWKCHDSLESVGGTCSLKVPNRVATETEKPATPTCNKLNLREVGYLEGRPSHSLYRREIDRSRSFDRWPSILRPLVFDLVESGFFYTGMSDEVVCHFCDSHLSSWNLGDSVPWRHTVACRECPFSRPSVLACANVKQHSTITETDETANEENPPAETNTQIVPADCGKQMLPFGGVTSASWVERTWRVVTRSVKRGQSLDGRLLLSNLDEAPYEAKTRYRRSMFRPDSGCGTYKSRIEW